MRDDPWVRGIDIVALHKGRGVTLLVEAKSATSATPGSPKHGREWKAPGVSQRVGDALYMAAKLCQTRKRGTMIALAFPDNALYREYTGYIRCALDRLRIAIIWVRARRALKTSLPL
jgi:hypothetical protein